MKPHVIAISLILLLGFSIYSNTFDSSFHFDDYRNIVSNMKLRDISNFVDVSGARYVGYLTLALNYQIGGLNVFGYHLVNVIIHIINAILVYSLILLLFKTPLFFKMGSMPAIKREGGDTGRLVALASSLIFLAHPVQTQAVTYIVQRFTSLATLFFLLSLVLFFRFRLNRRSALLYIGSLISAVLAMKTKQTSFTLPVVVVLSEFVFFTPKESQASFLKRLLYIVPFLLTMLIIPLEHAGSPGSLGEVIMEIGDISVETQSISRSDYLLTQFRVIVTYIRLLFLPINQNLDYDYPVFYSILEPPVFLSLLFILSILSLGVYLFFYSRRKGDILWLLAASGIFWFVITLSLESSIIPIKDVISEHRLYLPILGFTMIAAVCLFKLSRPFPSYVFYVLLLVVVLTLSTATYLRNNVWKSEISLWEDVVQKSPGNALAHNNLGQAFYKKGDLDRAAEEYQTAMKLRPFSLLLLNMGSLFRSMGKFELSEEYYQMALEANPHSIKARYGLANTYLKEKKIELAVKEYHEVLRRKPAHIGARNNLGLTYYSTGNLALAKREFEKVLAIKPDHQSSILNLKRVLEKMDRNRAEKR